MATGPAPGTLSDRGEGGTIGARIERTSVLGDPVSTVLRDARGGALYAAP